MPKSASPALLPSGFADLLPEEAGQEYAAITSLMAVFSVFGYARVKPPLVEFEESLFAPGPGAALINDTFRVMDPVSHRMMGVRSDITAQIARISASRLADEPRPLRLTYANDVLRTRASQQRTERQFCQAGCEIIGEPHIEAEIEACVVALAGLQTLGIERITLDLALPPLTGLILEAHDVDPDVQQIIKTALAKRDIDTLAGLDQPLADIFGSLLSAAGPGEKALKALKSMQLEGEMNTILEEVEAVHNGVARAVQDLGFRDIAITIDPAENRGFKYYCGIGFTLFAEGVFGALGRGGRYNVQFAGGQREETASGFTLYMDTVRQAMPVENQSDMLFVPYDTDWATIKKLQDEGWRIIRGDGKTGKPSGCTHVLKNGKVETV